MNKVILIGRLTRDVEIKGEQTKYAKFTIAVNRKIKNNEGKYEADFISCIAFSKTAEFIQKYFSKGSEIVVIGRLQTGSYDDQNGKKVHTTDVVVEEVEFCGKRLATEQVPAHEQVSEQVNQGLTEGLTETLPF